MMEFIPPVAWYLYNFYIGLDGFDPGQSWRHVKQYRIPSNSVSKHDLSMQTGVALSKLRDLENSDTTVAGTQTGP